MNNRQFTFNDGMTVKRVNKATARRLFNEGVLIGFCPVNINPLSPWGVVVFRDNDDTDGDKLDFDKFVNAFTYYNCNNEAGKYPAFYAKI